MNAIFHASFGITDFWTFLVGTIFIVLLPGPNSIYVLSIGAQRGVRQGYLAACGVFLGDWILMILSACGAASLLKTSPLLFTLVKYSGAAYLAWIGLQMLLGCWRKLREKPAAQSEQSEQSAQAEQAVATKVLRDPNPFRKALLISVMNPKAILFFISFFVQFVDPAFGRPLLSFAVLGMICQVISFLYLTALIFLGVQLAAAFQRRRKVAGAMSAGVGVLFMGFGFKLATATI